jgi:HEAT repeat protein
MASMGKRLSVDDRLSSIRRLRDEQPSAAVLAELRSALHDKSNLIVAAAAAIVGDQKHADLHADLEAAFQRFLIDPVKNDKLCRAKIAIVQSLENLGHEPADLFLRAAGHVQLEPVWGGTEDTGAPLRALAILALARLDYHGLLPLLVDSLADSHKDVRIAAAQALGYHGSEAASLLLRLKALMGDKESEVIWECLSCLLTMESSENISFVSRFLDSGDIAKCEAAIIALGRSRVPAAFDLLNACWQRHPIGLDDEVLLAMAMLRLPASTEFLLEIVATGQDRAAHAAMSALLIHRYDPSLRQRIAVAVKKNGSGSLLASFLRESETED